MATIGLVTKKNNGSFEGHLRTLSINAPITIQPVTPINNTSPAYRIVSNGAEVGAGWIKKAKASGEPYVSLTFEAPELPSKIYANLGQAAGQDDEDVFAIIWNRKA
jgi:uncharacterized protein (DUF736 family)